MLILGPAKHQEWGYQKSLPRTVTTSWTHQVTFLHTQESKILCALTGQYCKFQWGIIQFTIVYKLAPHIKVKIQSCIQRCLQNLVHQNLVQQANLYSINNRQELTYQKNALRHRSFPPVVFLTKIMETTLFSPPCITLSH